MNRPLLPGTPQLEDGVHNVADPSAMDIVLDEVPRPRSAALDATALLGEAPSGGARVRIVEKYDAPIR
eukprot:9586567-Alexandrium_andersonii.AAC.1